MSVVKKSSVMELVITIASSRALYVGLPTVCLSCWTVGDVQRARVALLTSVSDSSAKCVVKSYCLLSTVT